MPQVNNVLTLERFGDTYAKATPFASGKKLVLSPDDVKSLVTLQSLTGQIGLLDGRNLASNGWLVVSEVIPSGKTGVVIQWMLTPNSISTWKREPVIAHSQVGYHPEQQKVAVIELDPNDKPLPNATLYRICEDGKQVKVLDAKLAVWGNFTPLTTIVNSTSPALRNPAFTVFNMEMWKAIHFLSGKMFTQIPGILHSMYGCPFKWITCL